MGYLVTPFRNRLEIGRNGLGVLEKQYFDTKITQIDSRTAKIGHFEVYAPPRGKKSWGIKLPLWKNVSRMV